jgi:cell division protein FtsW
MSTAKSILYHLKGDRTIWAIVGMLALFSILAVYSIAGSIAYSSSGGVQVQMLKHAFILMVGLGVVYVASKVEYINYSRLAPFMLVVAVVLLVYTLGYGTEINDAHRWITVPFVGLTFQTSDFAKLALIVYVARSISKKQDYIKDLKSAFVPIIIPIVVICGLIAPADLSTALLLFVTCMMMMFIGRVSMKYIFLLIAFGVLMMVVLIAIGTIFPDVIRVDTWISRVNEFLGNTDGGYQVQQAKIAVADGSWFGVGPGNSIQRNFLPFAHADFIYAIICEEYGLLGAFLIIGLYLGLFLRAVVMVTKCPKAFGAVLAIGLSLSLIIQAFANIAVSLHLVPVTGLTLPMVSMGGTSMLFTCVAFGMILSVSRYIESATREAGVVKIKTVDEGNH